MKHRYWLFSRRGVYYLQDSETGRKESLNTRDRREAERLRIARNEAASKPLLGLTLGRAYLAAHDPNLVRRSWKDVMDLFVQRGKESSRVRRLRAVRSPSIARLTSKKLIETTADDLRASLADQRPGTNHFLRVLHNLAVGLGWLPWPILTPKLWPKCLVRPKRGITPEEHQRIVAAETDPEKRTFYQMLWEIGASQIDAASLTSENVDWSQKILSYQRRKTGQWAHLMIGTALDSILRTLPQSGALFPKLNARSSSERSAEFRRRCRLLGLHQISLHSYRYGWAERARSVGYPERWAQNALGHSSRAVHAAYARGSTAICPPMEAFANLPNHNSTNRPQAVPASQMCTKDPGSQ